MGSFTLNPSTPACTIDYALYYTTPSVSQVPVTDPLFSLTSTTINVLYQATNALVGVYPLELRATVHFGSPTSTASATATITVEGNPCLSATLAFNKNIQKTFTIGAVSETVTLNPLDPLSGLLDPYDIYDISTGNTCIVYTIVDSTSSSILTGVPSYLSLSYPNIAYTSAPLGTLSQAQLIITK